MNNSDLPGAARDLDEASKLEAQSILEAAEQDAEQLVEFAYRLGVSPSDIDYAPGNSALDLAAATRAEGRKKAVEYRFRARAAICWRYRPELDVEAFTAELDPLWHAAGQEFQIMVPPLSEESKRQWRAWALRARAAAGSRNADRAIYAKLEETPQDRARRRLAVVMPILARKHWKPGRLVTEAGVGKGSVYEYLDGTRKSITGENRKAIADALGIKPEDLPE